MKHLVTPSRCIPVLLAVALAPLARAVDAGPIAIHGAVSGTVAYSDQYNYLGDTKGQADLVNTEITLNGAHRFDNGIGMIVQLYAYELAGYKDVTLDIASLDYSFSPMLGIRAGRIKEPWSLYADVQDIDMVRPFVLLPQGQYAKEFRPLKATLDGASLYGQFSMGPGGDLHYQIFGGRATPADAQQPAVQYIIGASTPIYIENFHAPESLYGVHLTWDTPVEGLRAGASIEWVHDITMSGPLKESFGPFAGQPGSIRITDSTHVVGYLEYTRGDWVFAAEYFTRKNHNDVTFPFTSFGFDVEAEYYYGMVTWQATDKLQLGAYYEEVYPDKNDRHGTAPQPDGSTKGHAAWSKDVALAASYSLTPWWLVKAEVHVIDGTALVPPGLNAAPSTWDRNWDFFLVKSTISF